MGLSADKERVIREFDHLHEAVVRRDARNDHAVLAQLLPEVVVDFVPVSMSLFGAPEPAAAALQSEVWLKQFRGLTGDSNWQPVARSPLLPSQALNSAKSLTDAARTALILLSTAESIHTAVPLQ